VDIFREQILIFGQGKIKIIHPEGEGRTEKKGRIFPELANKVVCLTIEKLIAMNQSRKESIGGYISFASFPPLLSLPQMERAFRSDFDG
jgi:hypothetical protein